MPSPRGARRYAQAVFELAQEQGRLDEWSRDLTGLAGAAQEPSFATLLEMNRMPLDQRLAVVERVLPGLQPQALNLVALLASRNRVRLLGPIAEAYQDLLDVAQGIEEAEVVTAVTLEPSDVEGLRARLEQVRGRRIRLAHRQDGALLGGMVLRFGDHLVDGSLRTRLEHMRRALAGA